MDRRHYLAALGSSLATAVAGCSSGGDGSNANTARPTATPTATRSLPRTVTGPSSPGTAVYDEEMTGLLDDWGIPGAGLAVVTDGRLVLARGYGEADIETGEAVEPTDAFRIASLSKPVTAATVLRLVEAGDLSLADTVGDHLGEFLPESGPPDQRVESITVEQLLTHTGGWDRSEDGATWAFQSERVAEAVGETPPASPGALTRFALAQGVHFDPGSDYAYSNVGYVVLGRIVEAVTGQGYETAVRERLLSPAGAAGMQVGHTRRSKQAESAVRYHSAATTDSVFPDQGTVPWPYGGFYVQGIDAAGGWVASPVDLARVLQRVNGRGPVPDLLSAETTETMTADPDVPGWRGKQHYGLGWYVQPTTDTWWHNGSLPGSASILVRRGEGGLGWAAMVNARPGNWQQFVHEFDRSLRRAAQTVDSWPDVDHFDTVP